MQTILLSFGTRPEAIKMAPLVAALRARPEAFRVRVCVTGQHREMLDAVLARFELTPDRDLDLMRPGQTPAQVTARVLDAMGTILAEEGADRVVVQGDTTTAMATALAAFYAEVPVAHVEAGLRSGRMDAPFPEEMNRVVIDSFADALFPPTEDAAENLRRAGVPEERILVTGNTAIDALLHVRDRLDTWELPIRDRFRAADPLVLVTCHRRESFGAPLEGILRALDRIARAHPDATFVYPVHPNPQVTEPVSRLLSASNLHTIPPVDHADLVWLLDRADLVLTDSGGIQEEAPTLGTPLLVLREVTERPAFLAAGAGLLVGCDEERIVATATRVLGDAAERARLGTPRLLYGDGRASERIADHLAGLPTTPWQAPAAAGTAP